MSKHLTDFKSVTLSISELSQRLKKIQDQLRTEHSFRQKVCLDSTSKGPLLIKKDSFQSISKTLLLNDSQNQRPSSHYLRPQSTRISDRKKIDFSLNSSMKLQKDLQVNFPLSPSQAYQKYKHLLSPHQLSEILQYSQIFFVGLKSRKIRNYNIQNNNGYDDQKGDYKIVLEDHIAYRYEVQKILGKGSFGHVVQVFDHKTKTQVALKIIRNKTRFHQQGAIEVKLLKLARQHQSSYIVEMKSYFVFRKHLCITFQLLSSNLYQIMKSNHFKGFSATLLKRVAHQILQGLQTLQHLKIIHCDLKPQNILFQIPNQSSIKLIDLGSSCLVHEKLYTYIQSRFYRAPQIMLGLQYNTSIDMWSFGCILAQLQTGYPLFPGQSELDQFLCIMQYKGLPPSSLLNKASRKKIFFNTQNQPRLVVNSRGRKRIPNTKSLQDFLRGSSQPLLDLIQSKNYIECLEWDPNTRITPFQALRHPFFSTPSKKPRHLSSYNPRQKIPLSTKNYNFSFLF